MATMTTTARTAMYAAVASLTLAVTAPPLSATSCRDTCGPAVAACMEQGYRKRFCAREVLQLCKRGSAICAVPPASTPVCVTPTTTTTTTLPTSAPCQGASACGAEPSGISSRIGSAEELRTRLLGVWFDCKNAMGLEPFGGPSAGLEFATDGAWYFLNDSLARKTGFGQAGTFEILDTSLMNGPGYFQLNLYLNTGGLMIAQWTLAESPQLLLVNNNGVQAALYAHVSGPSCASSAASP
jgi:hypothetical protein